MRQAYRQVAGLFECPPTPRPTDRRQPPNPPPTAHGPSCDFTYQGSPSNSALNSSILAHANPLR